MQCDTDEMVLIQFHDTSTNSTSQPFQVPINIHKNQLLELIDRKSTLFCNGHIITHDLLSVLPDNFNREERVIIKTSNETSQKAAVYCSSSFSGHESAVLSLIGRKEALYTVGGDCTIRKWNTVNKLQTKISRSHTHWIQVVKWFGNRVFTGSMDALVNVYDEDLNVISTLKGHNKGITGIEMVDNMVVTSSRDKSVKFWKERDDVHPDKLSDEQAHVCYECIYSYAHDGIISGLCVHDGRLYSYSKDGTVKVYQGLTFVSEMRLGSPVNTLKISGEDVFAGCEDGSVYKNKQLLFKQSNVISSLDVSHNGIFLVVGSFNKKVCIYTTDGSPVTEYFHFSSVYRTRIVSCMVYSCGKDRTIRIFSLRSKKVVSTLICRDEVYDFDVIGEMVVAACRDGKVYFFE